MANWSNPTLSSLYTAVLDDLKNRDTDLALQFDGTTSSNLSVGTIRWSSSAGRWQKWSGTTWGELATSYNLTTITATGSITGTSLIPSSSTVPTNGIYLPATNTVGLATNSTERVTFSTTGVAFNAPGNNYDFRIEGDTDANLFFVDASADKIGISTNTPQSLLDLGRGDEGRAISWHTDSTTANSNIWSAYGSGRLTLGSNLKGSTSVSSGFESANSASIAKSALALSNLGLLFYTDPAATAAYGTAVTPTERLRITTTGDVNIKGAGTAGSTQAVSFSGSAPVNSLVVDTSGRLLVGTSTARANFYNTTNGAQIQFEGNDNTKSALAIIQDFNANSLGAQLILAKNNSTTLNSNVLVAANDRVGVVTFQGNDGSQFVQCASITAEIDATPGADDMPGRLVFSTTADGASSSTERMRIYNSGEARLVSTTSAFGSFTTAAAGTTVTLFMGRYSATAGNPSTGTDSVYIWSNGNIQNTNNSYTAISDIKLKENIVDAGSQWADLKALRVRNYNLKKGQTHRQIGLVAQEVEPISPGLVYEFPDRDAEGNDLGTVTKSVNYSVLYMKAVKALQEAMLRIESLEAKVAALEAR